MPSVYQLHAHVSAHMMSVNSTRRHYLKQVIDNLRKRSDYYEQALILTSKPLCLSDRR
jgi:hypothetical protein